MPNPPPVIAIDPGPTECGVVEWWNDGLDKRVIPTQELLERVTLCGSRWHLAIEMVQHYGSGMAVGKSVFDTCIVIGRLMEAFGDDWRVHLLTRPQIKTHLCGTPRAKDTNVRQALIDRFGGSLKAAKGTKKEPGPLYGIKSHAWAALAVAVTFRETWNGKAGE